MAGGELIEDDPEREEVAAAVEHLTFALLGRHVAELALDLPRLGAADAIGRLRHPEIEELYGAVVADEHVLRVHVAVNEVLRVPSRVEELMGGVQSGADLGDDVGRELRRQLLADEG